MRFFYVLVLVQALFLANVDAFQTSVPGPLKAPSVGNSAGRPAAPLSMAKDETLIDRLTGPKLFKTVTNWNGIHSVPLVPLRILTGLLMIHHGSEGACVLCKRCLDASIHPYIQCQPSFYFDVGIFAQKDFLISLLDPPQY